MIFEVHHPVLPVRAQAGGAGKRSQVQPMRLGGGVTMVDHWVAFAYEALFIGWLWHAYGAGSESQ